MTVLISKTYERWDDEALEAGDTDDKGFEFEAVPHTFSELVSLMQWHCEPSQSPNDGNRHVWLTDTTANEGTGDYYALGIQAITAIHFDAENSEHKARYWKLAMRAAGIKVT